MDKQIKGCRDLSQEEIDLMNKIKEFAALAGNLVADVDEFLNKQAPCFGDDNTDVSIRFYSADPYHWAQRAKDNLQDGFMKLTRAVAQPTTF